MKKTARHAKIRRIAKTGNTYFISLSDFVSPARAGGAPLNPMRIVLRLRFFPLYGL